MNTRVVFDPAVLHAIRVRGLTVGELARHARLSPATVSAAIHGKPLNVRSAVLLARALAGHPVIPELEEWTSPRDGIGSPG
ncbi:MAG TPA: helix-turn-helix transcriptional regulator [Acidimicrobiales bacterium]|nr:helix-turn-helix transcriptional regulator [Acidimicrobiales bacterium]